MASDVMEAFNDTVHGESSVLSINPFCRLWGSLILLQTMVFRIVWILLDSSLPVAVNLWCFTVGNLWFLPVAVQLWCLPICVVDCLEICRIFLFVQYRVAEYWFPEEHDVVMTRWMQTPFDYNCLWEQLAEWLRFVSERYVKKRMAS